MSTSLPRRLADSTLVFPSRRPLFVLGVTALLVAGAALAVSRVRPDASLESMFSRDDRAAAALVRVLNEFSAAEEMLVLATVPDDAPVTPDEAAARLRAFAGRFEAAVARSPDAAAMAGGVAWRADPAFRHYVEKVLVPNGLFYLDDASFAAARQRLTPADMREQIARNEAAVSQPGPGAAALNKVLLKDPLRLHEFVLDRLAGARGGFRTYRGGEEFISPDGRALLVRVAGTRPVSDLDFARQFTATIRRVAESANEHGLHLAYGGAYAIATTSERSIRRDMTASITSSVVFLLVLFAVVSRRPLRSFSLAFVPVALGVGLGFGAYALFSPMLTPLTGAVGAVLAGMGIDYTIHYLSHYQGRRAAGLAAAEAAAETSRHLGAPLLAAWLSSVIGFLAIGASSVAALRDFAVVGGLGLAGSLAATVFVLPAVLVLTDGRRGGDLSPGAPPRFGPRVDLVPLAQWIGRHSGGAIAASACVLLAAVGVLAVPRGELLPMEPDLTVMHPRPNPALAAQNEIARRFGVSPSSLIVHLKADSPEELVALAHDVQSRLSTPAVRDGGIAGTFGLAALLPDPRLAAARAAALPPGEANRVAADFRAAVADSAFDPAAFEPYAEFLSHLLSRREPPGMADLLRYPSLARTFLPTAAFDPATADGPAEAMTLVFLDRPVEERGARDAAVGVARAALADLPGATLTGMTVLSHDTEAKVRHELPRLFFGALGLVAVYLLLHFRSPRDALLSMLPTAFSLVCLLALMRLFGQKLNLMNLAAVPLLIGLCVDYGIFLVSLARGAAGEGEAAGRALTESFAAGCYALVMCAATTLLGFGSLITTSVPAMQSLGFVVGVGVLGCLYATLFALAPLLLRRAGDGHEGLREAGLRPAPQ